MGLMRGFLVSVFGTGLSRVLGFVRDLVITRTLGAGGSADVFWQAFTIPGMLRRFVADEGLTGALVPGIAKAEAEGGSAAAQALADQVFSALLLVNAVIVALAMCFPEPLVWMVASGFARDPEKFALTVSMTRWLMPFLATVSLVSFFEGLLNYRGHFLIPKMAPGLVSATIAASVVFFGDRFADPAWALVWGTGVGGAIHLLVHLPVVRRIWGPVRWARSFRGERFRAVVRELLKVVGIGIFAQLNIIVLRTLASWLPDGAVTHYTIATRLIDFTQGIVAVALGSALLPALSSTLAEGRWDAFRADLVRALRLAAFLLFPAAVGVAVYAVPLVAVVYLNARFGWEDVLATASTLRALAPFMLAVAGVGLLKRVFFALDRRTAVLTVGACGVVITGVAGWFGLARGVVGLGAALSIATLCQLLAYGVLLRSYLGQRFDLGALAVPLAKMAMCTLPMGLFAWLCARQGDWRAGLGWVNGLWFGSGIAGAVVIYGATAWILGLEELRAISRRLKGRLGSP